VTTTIAFFIAEMGDKTQLATVALGARFDMLVAVVLGTTLGMLIANIPAVLVGEALSQKLPMQAIRYAAGVFIATALATMFGIPGTAQ
jgi:putative Ca2+/H+ antiporter (TMEM165/GDT1 family)